MVPALTLQKEIPIIRFKYREVSAELSVLATY